MMGTIMTESNLKGGLLLILSQIILKIAKLALRKTMEQEKSESSGRNKGVAEKTGKVHGKPFSKMERQQADHPV